MASANAGIGVLNSTNYKIIFGLSMGATHYYEMMFSQVISFIVGQGRFGILFMHYRQQKKHE
jgi:hypothetical protein